MIALLVATTYLLIGAVHVVKLRLRSRLERQVMLVAWPVLTGLLAWLIVSSVYESLMDVLQARSER